MMALFYNYIEIFNKRPQATHTWRQTDGAALARNYFQNGLDFFSPQLQSVEYNEGHTVAELPVVYYLSAISYKLFGFKEGYFRLVNFFIFLLGLTGFFYTSAHIIKSKFWGAILASLLFACPVIAYYAFNFLPDSTALGFMLLGFTFMYDWHEKKTTRSLLFFILFTAIAGAIKITSLYFPLSFVGAIFLTSSFKKDNKDLLKLVFSFVSILGFSLIWLFWSMHYKALHHSEYFLQSPVTFSFSKIVHGYSWKDIFNILVKNSFSVFYSIPLLTMIGLSSVLIFKLVRHVSKFDLVFLVLNTIGAFSVLMLFYFQYSVHDYYAVIWVVTGILWIVYLAKYLRLFYNKNTYRLASVCLLLLWGLSIVSAKNVLDFRYNNLSLDNNLPLELHSIEPFLIKLNIPKEGLFITPDDFTSNASLYFLNRKGYTGYFLASSWDRYEMAMQKNMRYLACWNVGREHYEYESKLKPVLIGTYGKVRIYKLTY